MRYGMSARRAGRKLLASALALALSLQPLLAQEVDTGAKAEIAARNAIAMQRSLQALEDGLAEIPRDRWDPQDVVDTVGIDAPLLYRFLRSRTRWVPYSGALRGPVGVLMDQRGNSLDQSLLLAQLYELAGFEVRLAHGVLDDATIDTLLAAWRNPVPLTDGATENPGPAPAESPAALAADYDLPPDAIQASLQAGSERATDVGTRLNELAANQVSAIAASLGTLPAEREKAMDESLLRKSLADHWWVEVNDNGWQAADPLEPGATFGKALTLASETLAPGDLPEDLWHRVTIRLVIEQAKGGKALQGTVLEQKVRAADMIGQVIRVEHYPTQWPATWPSTTPSDLQTKLRAALATQKEWLPTLAIGEQEFNNGSIKDNGDINLQPTPINPFAVIGVPVAGDISKVVDALSLPGEAGQVAPGEQTAVGSEGELTAEWLDFTIERPGLPPEEIRRTLFDIAGPAFRAKGDYAGLKLDDKDRFDRSMAMLGQVQAMILPAAPSAGQILARQAEQIVANKPILDEIAKDPFGEIPGNIVELLGKLKPVPVMLDGFVSARFSQSPVGDAVFVQEPMIVALHNELGRDRNTGDFTTQAALDIVSSGVGVDPLSGFEPFKARLVQGIHDTLTEALALGGGAPDVINAALAFERDNYGWTLVREAGDPQLAGLDPDFAARLTADLSSGAYVLVPPKAEKGREVWWKIDPRTGETLGYGPRGWGTSLVEYAFVLVIKTLLSQIACMASHAAVDASMNAFEKGNPGLPKNWDEVKKGAKNYAKTCVSKAMLSQLTGISTVFLMNGASGLNRAVEGGLRSRYGTDPYWEARSGGGASLGGVGGTPQAGGAGNGGNGPPGGPPPGSGPPGGPPPGSGGKGPPGGPPPGSGPPGGPPPGSGGKGPPGGPPPGSGPPGGPPPGSGGKGPPSGPPPGSGRISPQEAQSAHERAVAAERRAYEAKARRDANPTPENQKAWEQANRDYNAAMQERLNAWSRSGSDKDPPKMPSPSIGPASNTGGKGPPGGPPPGTGAKSPEAQAPAGAPPDIPRGLPPKPPGYKYGQSDIDEWTAKSAEYQKAAEEAGTRYNANPTPENQASYENALRNLGNANQNRVEAWQKGGRQGDLSGSAPPKPGSGGSGSLEQTGVQTTQPDGSPNPALQPTLPLPAAGGGGGGSAAVDPLGQTGQQQQLPDGRPNPALQPTLPLPAAGGGGGSAAVDPLGQTGLQQQLPDGRPNPALQPTMPLPAAGGGAGAGDVISPAANSVPPAGLPQPPAATGTTSPGLGLGATQGYNSLLLGLSGLGNAVKP